MKSGGEGLKTEGLKEDDRGRLWHLPRLEKGIPLFWINSGLISQRTAALLVRESSQFIIATTIFIACHHNNADTRQREWLSALVFICLFVCLFVAKMQKNVIFSKD